MNDRIAPNDPVEAGMGEGTILRREKVVARNLALLCLVLFLAFGAGSIAYLSGWQADKPAVFRWITYGLVPMFAWIGLTKTVLRTVVTTREISVQQGLRGTRIPISSIKSARIFGAERPEGGTELYFPAGLKGVLVDWCDERGKTRKTLIGSEAPAQLITSIDRARGAKEALRISPATAPTEQSEESGEEEEPSSESRRRARS